MNNNKETDMQATQESIMFGSVFGSWRQRAAPLLALAALLGATTQASAQTTPAAYPSKPVRVV
ncbi:MAG: hypothetical protein B7Y54_03740, partial [Polaromonas sp. 35-63-240]